MCDFMVWQVIVEFLNYKLFVAISFYSFEKYDLIYLLL